jgi:hypothetical protein
LTCNGSFVRKTGGKQEIAPVFYLIISCFPCNVTCFRPLVGRMTASEKLDGFTMSENRPFGSTSDRGTLYNRSGHHTTIRPGLVQIGACRVERGWFARAPLLLGCHLFLGAPNKAILSAP